MNKNRQKARNDDRGRRATRPGEIPKSGWRDIIVRVKNQISDDNINIVAAGIAFYAFLAIFPAITALISLYGLVVDPQTVQQQFSGVSGFLPQQARQLLNQQLSQIAAQSSQSLGWGLVLSILLGLWSANKGSRALFTGLNIAYNEKSSRGFIKENALTLLFTLYAIAAVIISMILIVAFPAAVGNLGLPSVVQTLIGWLRWLLLAALILLNLALLYRYAPDRDNPQWRWVSWGSVAATVLWLAGSWLFSLYVSNFGNYNETYGSVAAVIILLLWFLLTAFIILLGAEINSEMEHQTREDTTRGPRRPMGKREAYHADHVGKTP